MFRIGAYARVGILVLVSSIFLTSHALADRMTYAEGFEGGVVLPGGYPSYTSPAIAEVDGNTSDGKEIVASSADGWVHVYKSDGTRLWSNRVPNYACLGAESNRLMSSPAVGAIYGDGIPYVVIGYGGVTKGCDGGVVAYNGATGAKKWNFSLKKFAAKQHFWSFSYSVFSTPALSDTDGDGKMEIGFGSFDRNVYLLNSNGSVRWYYNAADTVWSSPAFANADSKGPLEMLIGTDISQNKQLRPPTSNGGYVYAFKTRPLANTHIGFRNPTSYNWKTDFNQTMFSSPVVADVIPESPGLEVIIGSGCFFPQNTSNKNGKWFKVLRLKDGKLLRTLPTIACSPSSAAVGDIDDDGVLEVVITSSGNKGIGGNGSAAVMAYKASTSTLLWQTKPTPRGTHDTYGGDFTSPIIGDLDGNGSLEVVVSNSWGVAVLEGKTGVQLTCSDASCSNGGPLMGIGRPTRTTPAMGDINLDGKMELVVVSSHHDDAGHGGLYVWSGFENVLHSSPGQQPAYSTPWPMTRGNAQHTGLYSK